MDVVKEAQKIFREDAEDYVVQEVEALVKASKLEWVEDPVVPAVVGCVEPKTNRAVVVVYVGERDFELNEERLLELRRG